MAEPRPDEGANGSGRREKAGPRRPEPLRNELPRRTEPRRRAGERNRLDQPRDSRIRLPRFDPEAFGRWSEAIARFMGTARFLVYMTVVILIWIAWNTLTPSSWRFDPYTFTFLTLVLSLQASYAAPLILLAQNRQADRDRLIVEEDRRRAAMQKADTEYLTREIASLRIALGEVVTRDFLRGELSRLGEELSGSLSPDERQPDERRSDERRSDERAGKARKEPRRLRPDAGITIANRLPPKPPRKR